MWERNVLVLLPIKFNYKYRLDLKSLDSISHTNIFPLRCVNKYVHGFLHKFLSISLWIAYFFMLVDAIVNVVSTYTFVTFWITKVVLKYAYTLYHWIFTILLTCVSNQLEIVAVKLMIRGFV